MKRLMKPYFTKAALNICGAIAVIFSVSLNENAAFSATTDTNKDGITVEVIGDWGPGEIRITKSDGSVISIGTPDGDDGTQWDGPYAYDYAIAAGPNNFVLVYSGERMVDGQQLGEGLYQFYDYNGNRIGKETRFTEQTNQGSGPVVISLRDGNYLLVWQTNNPIGYPVSPVNMVIYIVGRVMNGDGLGMKNTFIVASNILLNDLNVSQQDDGQIFISSGSGGAWHTTYGSDIGQFTAGTIVSDNLYGNGGVDEIESGPEDDYIDGGEGPDILNGGLDDDIINGGPAGDMIYGGDGVDAASYNTSSEGVTVSLEQVMTQSLEVKRKNDASGDRFVSIENLIGSSYSDNLSGDKFNNKLIGGASGDSLDGRGGSDTASYEISLEGVLVDLGDPSVNKGDAAGDIYKSVENVIGTLHSDSLTGDSNNNKLVGLSGDDTIKGLEGSDTLQGNEGMDILNGGVDKSIDTFIFSSVSDSPVGANRDTIINFKIANDKIDLSKIDANTKVKGNQAFLFSNSMPTANSVWFVKNGKDVLVRGDVDGNTKADFEFLIKNTPTVMQTTFVL